MSGKPAIRIDPAGVDHRQTMGATLLRDIGNPPGSGLRPTAKRASLKFGAPVTATPKPPSGHRFMRAFDPLPGQPPLALVEHREGLCRWPVGEEPIGYCGAEVHAEGANYCPHHQQLEQHDGLVIAATNFGGHVDPALWRRFDMHISLELPGAFEREQILKRYLSPFGLPKAAGRQLAAAFETASPALMRQFCEHLKRMLVVGPKLGQDMSKAAVIDRLVATVQPHPDLGKPPMWSTSADHHRDKAISALPWPLPMAAELPAEDVVPAAGGGHG